MKEDTMKISWPGWETIRLIGRGSFGAVYEIQRDMLGDIEKAALKVISIPQNPIDIEEMYNDGYDDESITSALSGHLKSILNEYSLMKKMSDCPNIVHSDDINYIQHEDGIGWDIFIKMELLTPLARILPDIVPEETVIKLAKDICNALVECKELGIIHRDIKPQNIFVSAKGDYKLGDFGIAKTVEKTMSGTMIGTYKYMAPEIYYNQPYNSAVDIYSLGLVLYWMLNEKRMPFMPLPPERVTSTIDVRSRERRFSGEQLPPPAHGSENLKRIVLKACAYNPAERYASTAEMLADLNGTAADMDALRRQEEEERRRKELEETERQRRKLEEQEKVRREQEATERLRREREAQEEQERHRVQEEQEQRCKATEVEKFLGEQEDQMRLRHEAEQAEKLLRKEREEAERIQKERNVKSNSLTTTKKCAIGICILLIIGTIGWYSLRETDDGFKTVAGKTYYYLDGEMQTGLQTIDGEKYYFDTDGHMLTGWVTKGQTKYYFDQNGVMQTGWQTINYSKFYFSTNGAMQTGFQTINGQNFYFSATGAMQTGWKIIGGKSYYFGPNGAMQTEGRDISG